MGPAEPARARATSARWRSRSRRPPAGASSRSGWPRSRPRSRAARRSSSSTTRSSATTQSKRKVDPYHLLYQGGQFYLVGHAHERDAMRVFRLSRITDKVSYASKAEHDFTTPDDFDPWAYARRADWQLGEPDGDRAGVDLGAHRVARRARLRPARRLRARHAVRQPVAGRVTPRPGPGRRLHDRVRAAAPARVVGAGPRRARAAARPVRARRRDRRAAVATILERHADAHPDFVAEPARRRARRRASRRTVTRPSRTATARARP